MRSILLMHAGGPGAHGRPGLQVNIDRRENLNRHYFCKRRLIAPLHTCPMATRAVVADRARLCTCKIRQNSIYRGADSRPRPAPPPRRPGTHEGGVAEHDGAASYACKHAHAKLVKILFRGAASSPPPVPLSRPPPRGRCSRARWRRQRGPPRTACRCSAAK